MGRHVEQMDVDKILKKICEGQLTDKRTRGGL